MLRFFQGCYERRYFYITNYLIICISLLRVQKGDSNMDNIVEEAMENSEEEERRMDEKLENMDISSESGDEEISATPNIVVVGCGGAGNNTVNRLYNISVDGATTIAINTDKQHLQMIDADTKILVGKDTTNGLGAGGDPEKGKRATEMAKGTIKEVLDDADLIFVTAGLGGGTGTGAAPVVAEIGKSLGAIVIGMVSTPFEVERARLSRAKQGLDNLKTEADSIIVLDNNRLLDYVPNLPVGKAFSVMDQIIAETVKGISETITQPSLINLDYADMKTIMREGGVAVMLVGETKEENKQRSVVDDALNHPLLDVDYRGATGGLVHITGGPNMSLKEAEGIASNITERLQSDSNVIWGARVDEEYQNEVRVMAIMTGVDSQQVMSSTPQTASSTTKESESTSPQTTKQEKHGIDKI